MTYSEDVIKLNPGIGLPKPKRGKKTDRQKIEVMLDKLFSEFVRRRAMQRVGGCERCGSNKTDYKQLQCSHFIGRSTKQTRWHEDNGSGLCGGCHMYLEHHPHEHEAWMKERLGEAGFDLLTAQSCERGTVDVAGLILVHTQELKKLKEVSE